MIFKRADIPFANDDTHQFLPWLVGVMACLATLLLCLGLTINSWIVSHHSSYSGSYTVTVPEISDNADEKLNRIREALRRQPGVKGVTQLGDDQLKDMLKPWLGNRDSIDGLPLPTVLDVTLDNDNAVDYAAVEKLVSAIVPGTEVDAHERWVAAFSDFSKAAQCLMIILSSLILAAMGVMIAFTSRASLRLHTRTVNLLHAIGAEDKYIARQFQQEACRLVLPGAFFGALAAGVFYWITGMYMASLPVSVLPALSIGMGHVVLLLAMAPACGLAAWFVARHCVIKQLQATL